MKQLYIFALLGLLIFTGCRQAPTIQPIDNSNYLQKSGSKQEIAKAIERGASSKGWRTNRLKDGLIEANILVRNKHFVAVNIPYNEKGYKIEYKDSRNMDYDPTTQSIHGNYAKWTKILSERIDYEIMNIGFNTTQGTTTQKSPEKASKPQPKQSKSMVDIKKQPIYISPAIVYTSNSRVSTAIKQECTIPQTLSKHILEKTANKGINVQAKQKISSKELELKIEILEAVSAGNAAIGHSKYIVIEGYLTKNNVKYQSFKAARHSGGGAFGAYRSSCSVLGRITSALADDIANWLINPQDNALLGDVQLIR